ncbi:MAG: SsgA family sporulation/cell division regulator [Nocardioides sp.]
MTSQPITPVLAQHVTLRAPHCPPGSVELDALFEYDSRDPFAVWITFGSGAASIRWAMSRSLLAEGLTDPAGEGDLRLRPSLDQDGSGVVVFEFHSPDGRFVAQASTRELYRFLTRTLVMVPFGSESDHFDVDAIISDLMRLSESE